MKSGGRVSPSVNIAADLADIAMLFLFDLWSRLRFDVLKVVAVGNRRCVAQDCRFRDLRDKERMRAVIVGVDDLGGEERVGAECLISESVLAPADMLHKSVNLSVSLPLAKPETLEGIEGKRPLPEQIR